MQSKILYCTPSPPDFRSKVNVMHYLCKAGIAKLIDRPRKAGTVKHIVTHARLAEQSSLITHAQLAEQSSFKTHAKQILYCTPSPSDFRGKVNVMHYLCKAGSAKLIDHPRTAGGAKLINHSRNAHRAKPIYNSCKAKYYITHPVHLIFVAK